MQSHDTVEPEIAAVMAIDTDLSGIVARFGPPPDRGREGGFAALLEIILGQQVSAAAADAMWRRLSERLGMVTPTAFLSLDDAELKRCGFSRGKIAYGRGLADAVTAGQIDFDALVGMDDDAVADVLTALKGIGTWTAHVYLLFCLKRKDIWPVGDLAIVEATRRLKGLAERPNRAAMMEIGEAWRPYRSAAARLLWHAYRHERGEAGMKR